MYRYLISQLYGGNIDPCGRTIDKTSKRFLQDRRIADLASTFRKSLTPEQTTMFEEYKTARKLLLRNLSGSTAFKAGTRKEV